MKDTVKKRECEKRMFFLMIALYCRKKHGTAKNKLCPDCLALAEYAKQRSDRCPFMETKTFCSNCKVHCYKPEMREKIRAGHLKKFCVKAIPKRQRVACKASTIWDFLLIAILP